VPVLSDVAVTFLGSILLLTVKGQLLGYATVAFGERRSAAALNVWTNTSITPLWLWSGE